MKIHHFAIKVTNIDKSIKFYTEKLGFKIKTPKTLDGIYFYSNLVFNESDIELELIQVKNKTIKKIKNNTPPICPHIALESFDFDKDLQMLKEKGVKIFDGPHIIPNDVKILTILDPDNYRIDIGQLIK